MQDCVKNDLLFNAARTLEHTIALLFSTLNFVKPSMKKKKRRKKEKMYLLWLGDSNGIFE